MGVQSPKISQKMINITLIDIHHELVLRDPFVVRTLLFRFQKINFTLIANMQKCGVHIFFFTTRLTSGHWKRFSCFNQRSLLYTLANETTAACASVSIVREGESWKKVKLQKMFVSTNIALLQLTLYRYFMLTKILSTYIENYEVLFISCRFLLGFAFSTIDTRKSLPTL